MNLERKKKLSILCISAIIPTLLILASATYASNSEDSGEDGKTIRTVGGEQVRLNKVVSSDFHFSPSRPVHVRQGDTITLKETSGDGHTFTLVEASALPTTFNGIFFCGAPAIIAPGFVGSPACVNNGTPGYPFTLHLTPLFPPPWLPIPSSCTPGPICNQFVDGGVASNTNTLGLDTAWSFKPDGSVKTAGDSVLLLPGSTFTLTVTAPAGTHLHFMCVFHPWMQGEIIVDAAGD